MTLRLWPQRFTGQMIALVLAALLLSQIALMYILFIGAPGILAFPERQQLAERTASLVRVLESGVGREQAILDAASTLGLQFWLSRRQPLQGAVPEELLPTVASIARILGNPSREFRGTATAETIEQLVGADTGADAAGARFALPEVVVSVHLEDGRWLNAGQNSTPLSAEMFLPPLLSIILTAIANSVVVVAAARSLTAPLVRLGRAAEKAGRGELVDPLPESGPLDIRQTTRAFNQMHASLQRFVQDRTRMLAAISYDLRTPLTSLRLRVELLDDEEVQKPMVRTIEEMQRITEGTLAFARDDANQEETRTVDLSALVASACDDLAYVGKDVTFTGETQELYVCRPGELKRALRNLVENAVSYGKKATVSMERTPDGIRIFIDDEGPGIPPQEFERVFQPFVRLDKARSSASGGSGLGMSIARTVAQSDGGDIALKNRAGGGLRATIFLPAQREGVAHTS